jgi:hypothetical protein
VWLLLAAVLYVFFFFSAGRRVAGQCEGWMRQKEGHCLTHLTSPKAAGRSAVMAPPKRSTCLKVVAILVFLLWCRFGWFFALVVVVVVVVVVNEWIKMPGFSFFGDQLSQKSSVWRGTFEIVVGSDQMIVWIVFLNV